jgi:hypothetical protein
MPHGDAEPGCADGERRVREPEPVPAGRQLRRVCPAVEPSADPGGEVSAGLPVEAPGLPVEGLAPDVDAADQPPVRACRSERPGWAGAHRHGAVRPRRRVNRRERPPDRWC